MSLEVRLVTTFLLVFASLVATIAAVDSSLPGCIHDLRSAERYVVNQLRPLGYIVSDTGFS